MGKIRLLEKKTSAVLQEVERGNLVELDGGGGYGVVRHIIGRVPGKEDQTCSLKFEVSPSPKSRPTLT